MTMLKKEIKKNNDLFNVNDSTNISWGSTLITFILLSAIITFITITNIRNNNDLIKNKIENINKNISLTINTMYLYHLNVLYDMISQNELFTSENQQKALNILKNFSSYKFITAIDLENNQIKWIGQKKTIKNDPYIKNAITLHLPEIDNHSDINLSSQLIDFKYFHKLVLISNSQTEVTPNITIIVGWDIFQELRQFTYEIEKQMNVKICLAYNGQLINESKTGCSEINLDFTSKQTYFLFGQEISYYVTPTPQWYKLNNQFNPFLAIYLGFLFNLISCALIFYIEKQKCNSIKYKFLNTQLNLEIEKKKKSTSLLKTLNRTFNLACIIDQIGIWNWDLDSNKVFWNEVMYSIYEIDLFISPTYHIWQQAVIHDDLVRTEKLLQECIENGTKFNTVFRILTPNKKIKYIRAHGWVQRDKNVKAVEFIGINKDITDELRNNQIVNSLQLGLWELDKKSMHMNFEDNFAIKLGYNTDTFHHIHFQKWCELIHPDDVNGYRLSIELFIKKNSTYFEYEYRIQNSNNKWIWVNDRAGILNYPTKETPENIIVGMLSDISLRKKNEENFRFMAEHDGLTKLATRNHGIEFLKKSIEKSKNTNEPFGVLMIDINQFKQINDEQGHVKGDSLIKNFANRIKKTIRASDLVARLGGDEFIIIAKNLVPEYAINYSQMLIQAIEAPFIINGTSIKISASIGIAFFPTDGHTSTILIDKADKAMYQAKKYNNKGSNIKIYTPSKDN